MALQTLMWRMINNKAWGSIILCTAAMYFKTGTNSYRINDGKFIPWNGSNFKGKGALIKGSCNICEGSGDYGPMVHVKMMMQKRPYAVISKTWCLVLAAFATLQCHQSSQIASHGFPGTVHLHGGVSKSFVKMIKPWIAPGVWGKSFLLPCLHMVPY